MKIHTHEQRLEAVKAELKVNPSLDNIEIQDLTGIHRLTVGDLRRELAYGVRKAYTRLPFHKRIDLAVEMHDKNPDISADDLCREIGGDRNTNQEALRCVRRGCRKQIRITDDMWPALHERVQAGEVMRHIAQEHGLIGTGFVQAYNRWLERNSLRASAENKWQDDLTPKSRLLLRIPFSRAGELFGNPAAA